jgi:opacity protein-like surface antigen
MRGRIMPCIAAALCVAVTTPAFAGDRPNSLRDGAWAVQFGIGDNFRLTNFQGSSFAIKRHVAERNAVRVIADVGFGTSNTDSDEASGTSRREVDNDFASGDLNVLFQRYINPDDDVAIYWGAGPIVGFEWSDDVIRNVQILSGEAATSEREDRDFSIGLAGVLGAEFFVIERISLHAEYTVSSRYIDSRTTRTTTDQDGQKREETLDGSSWRGDNGNVRFGLSAYF